MMPIPAVSEDDHPPTKCEFSDKPLFPLLFSPRGSGSKLDNLSTKRIGISAVQTTNRRVCFGALSGGDSETKFRISNKEFRTAEVRPTRTSKFDIPYSTFRGSNALFSNSVIKSQISNLGETHSRKCQTIAASPAEPGDLPTDWEISAG